MTDNIILKSKIQTGDLEKINRFSRRTLSEDELYVFTVRLCSNDIDRDFEKFSVEALEQMAKLFVGKTCIEDHSMKSSNQRARIFDTYVEAQDNKLTADGEKLHYLMGRAYMLNNDENKEFIDLIDAGIKKEVSVSCSMAKSVCSICSCERHTKPCNHINGKMYNGKLCFSVLSDATDAYELSFVAVPAQRDAGVVKSFKKQEIFNMDNILKTMKTTNGDLTLSKSQAKEICEYIDELKQEAMLGAQYKNQLVGEVTKSLSLNLPQVDSAMLSSIVSVMTTKELLEFKRALNDKNVTSQPQLLRKQEKNNKRNLSEFKI